jgi:hypothetical protein
MYDIGRPDVHLDRLGRGRAGWLLPGQHLPRRLDHRFLACRRVVAFDDHHRRDVALPWLVSVRGMNNPPGFDPRLGVEPPSRLDRGLGVEPEPPFDQRRGGAQSADGLPAAGMDVGGADRVAQQAYDRKVERRDNETFNATGTHAWRKSKARGAAPYERVPALKSA